MRKMLVGFVQEEATDPSKSNSCKVVGTGCSGLRSKQGVKNKRYILKNKGFHFIQGPSMIHN